MEKISTWDTISLKDFDLSFILDYEKDVLSIHDDKYKHGEGILKIFSEFIRAKSLIKITKFINLLMEKYGLIVLNSVVDNLVSETDDKMEEFISNLGSSVNKIIVFIDDPPNGKENISWMGRMLTVGLLSCGIIPLVIPWNDLLGNYFMIGLLRELSLLSPYKSTQNKTNTKNVQEEFNWILKKGFSLALKNSHKNIIIFDTDWNSIRIQEFIAEAEIYGYELIFMMKHTETNRINHVQKVMNKIKSRVNLECCSPRVKPIQPIIVEIVKHQDYSSNHEQTLLDNVNDRGDNEEFVEEFKEILDETITFSKENQEDDDHEIKNADITENSGRFSLKSKISTTPGFLKRIISNTKIHINPKISFERLCLKNKINILPKFFTSSNTRLNDDENISEESEEEIFNPHILPRLTDEQFDRILVQPKLFARKSKMEEEQLFPDSHRDLENLDSLFSNSIQSLTEPMVELELE